jgi:mono/diheme cytochrome c family protein
MVRRIASALIAVVVACPLAAGGVAARQAIPVPAPAPAPVPPVASHTASAAPPVSYLPLLTQYCFTCHNSRTVSGGLALDTLSLGEVPAQADLWERVIRTLRGRLMPPAGVPHPADSEVDGFIASVEGAIDAEAAAHPAPGFVVRHRLNRTEYGNAIRDILHLTQTDVASLLLPDDSNGGFDNVANVLNVPPTSGGGYVAAARAAARLAVGDMTAPMDARVYRAGNTTPQRDHVEGMPLGTRGGLLIQHYFPLDGEYTFDIALRQSQIYVKGLEFPHTLIVTIDGSRVFEQTVGGEADLEAQDQQLASAAETIQKRFKNLRFKILAGPHTVAVTFVQKTLAVSDEVLQPFFRDNNPSGGMNGIPAVERVEILGPYNPTGPGDTPARRAVFVCHPTSEADEPGCATRIFSAVATRAYRRPLTSDDLVTPLQFYLEARAKGDGFEKGIQAGLGYVLSSPGFVYRTETDAPGAVPGTVHRLSDLELASRLAFFLWSSVPDEPLVNLASSGRLSSSPILEGQVRRMLADPRADALVTNFFSQWLRLPELGGVDPDSTEYPNFEDDLRAAFKREMELFTGSIVRDDRSVLDLITAKDTFVNERLARHYGISGVRGDQFRRVTLSDPNRWGLLGKGSLLTVTSYANRTSPVRRGRWVLDGILGTPPPDPPADVPALIENQAGTLPISGRQRLEQHRAAPACANCHRAMDAAGFALENFDAVGQWRTRDHGVAIDADAELADGSHVDGPAALREAIMKRPDQFLRTFSEKLLTYALGRSVAAADMPAVRGILHDASRDNYKFSSLVMAVVRSAPFQLRQVPSASTAE